MDLWESPPFEPVIKPAEKGYTGAPAGNIPGERIVARGAVDDKGQVMTFIEAWADMPGYLPYADPNDTWAEGDAVHRLSTKVPGLGGATGLIDPLGAAMQRASLVDADVADLIPRTQDFYSAWLDEHAIQGADYFSRGCGW